MSKRLSEAFGKGGGGGASSKKGKHDGGYDHDRKAPPKLSPLLQLQMKHHNIRVKGRGMSNKVKAGLVPDEFARRVIMQQAEAAKHKKITDTKARMKGRSGQTNTVRQSVNSAYISRNMFSAAHF